MHVQRGRGCEWSWNCVVKRKISQDSLSHPFHTYTSNVWRNASNTRICEGFIDRGGALEFEFARAGLKASCDDKYISHCDLDIL